MFYHNLLLILTVISFRQGFEKIFLNLQPFFYRIVSKASVPIVRSISLSGKRKAKSSWRLCEIHTIPLGFTVGQPSIESLESKVISRRESNASDSLQINSLTGRRTVYLCNKLLQLVYVVGQWIDLVIIHD